jgi:predicted secreted protein
LQPAVDIEIVPLVIVLQEGCPEQVIGEIDFNPWCNQEEIAFAIRIREGQSSLL